MSRFVLITPNTDFDARVRQAVAGGLPGGVQTFAFVNPADPGELFANLNQERPEVLILGRMSPSRTRSGSRPSSTCNCRS